MTGLVEVTVLAGTLLAFAAWAATVFLSRAPVKRSSPGVRSLQVRLWLYAPLWVPPVVLLAAQVPGGWGMLVGVGDHCLVGDGPHHHLCVFHPPHLSEDGLPRMLGVGSWVVVFAVVLLVVRRILLARRLAETLVRFARPSSLGDDVAILEQDDLIAVSVGVVRPRILLSQGLLDAVCPQTLRVILAHERAHLSRRDMGWAQLDQLVASLLPRVVRRELLESLSLACEQACDAAAARSEGNVNVAASLTRIARLGVRAPAVGLSVAASSLEARVLHLLDAPSYPWWRAWPQVTAAIAIACLGAGPLHALLERILAPILH